MDIFFIITFIQIGIITYAEIHKSERVKQIEANQVKILVCDIFELEVNKREVLNPKTEELETVYDYYGKLRTDDEKCNERIHLGHKSKKSKPKKLKMVYYEKSNEYVVKEF